VALTTTISTPGEVGTPGGSVRRREQLEATQAFLILPLKGDFAQRRLILECRQDRLVEQRQLLLLLRVHTPLPGRLEPSETALHQLVIGQNQLQIDALDIARRVHRALRMQQLRILERPHHMDQRVDILQPLEIRALRSLPLLNPRDIDVLDRRGDVSLWGVHVAQLLESPVPHGGDTKMDLLRDRELVGRPPGGGEDIEECRLA
jgi:hypothetical protein